MNASKQRPTFIYDTIDFTYERCALVCEPLLRSTFGYSLNVKNVELEGKVNWNMKKTTNTWFKQETWHGNPPKTPSAESGAGWYFVTSPYMGLWRMLNTRWQYSHCSTSSTSHNKFHDFSNLSAYKLGSQPWPPCGRIWSKWSVALSH